LSNRGGLSVSGFAALQALDPVYEGPTQ
jgi:hypothetical protein